MPGDVGLVAKLVDSILHFVTDEDQLKETLKRVALAKKKKEYIHAVSTARTADDFATVRRIHDEYERLCNQA
jgi:hypothetical protein